MQVHESPKSGGFFWVVDDNKEAIEGPFFYAAEAQEWIEDNSK